MANNNDKKVLNVPALRFPEFSGEWKSKFINDLASVVGGGTPDTSVKSYWDGNIQWFTPSEIGKNKYVDSSLRTITEEGLNNSSAKLLPPHTILLSSRATVGECSLSLKECATNQGFQSLIAQSCDTNFLYYLIQTKKKDLIRKACGSTFLEISANEVRKIQVKIPYDNEQKKIADFLSLIDERIFTQNKIIEDLKKLKSAIYQDLFSNLQGDEISLSELAEIVKGQQVNGDELSENGKYYVMNGGIMPSGYYDDYNTKAGTISISEGGNSCGYVQYNTTEFWSGGHCYTLHIKPTAPILTLFLFHYLKWKEADIMMLRIGSGLPNIQKKDLSKVRIIVPTLDKQQQQIALLSSLQMKIESEEMYLINLDKQKQYLLSQMFI